MLQRLAYLPELCEEGAGEELEARVPPPRFKPLQHRAASEGIELLLYLRIHRLRGSDGVGRVLHQLFRDLLVAEPATRPRRRVDGLFEQLNRFLRVPARNRI